MLVDGGFAKEKFHRVMNEIFIQFQAMKFMTEGISDVSWLKHLFLIARKAKRASENCVTVLEIVYVEKAMTLTFMNEACEGFYSECKIHFVEVRRDFKEFNYPILRTTKFTVATP